MKSVDELIIYKQCLELIYYTEMITRKYPKVEKYSIVSTIKNDTYDCIKQVIMAYKTKDKNQKLLIFNNLDVDLKMIKVLIRVSIKNNYINRNNYKAWSKKITNIGNLLGGWINSCVKQ